jgi:hypothetical protein
MTAVAPVKKIKPALNVRLGFDLTNEARRQKLGDELFRRGTLQVFRRGEATILASRGGAQDEELRIG